MSQQIAAAIILNGILDRIERGDTSMSRPSGIRYDVPEWFSQLHPRQPFPKLYPKQKPPANTAEDEANRLDRIQYENEKEAWEIGESLRLLRKWVIWCADFCDIKQGFSITLNGLLDE